jgi:hypothetical protein
MTRAWTVAGLVTTLLVATAVPVAAGTPIDFGSVAVGEGSTQSAELPLTYSLSELPPETVLYTGGDPSTDFVVQQMGLSLPVTAGSLYSVTGEITATYHLSLVATPATDFTIDDDQCATATGICTASVTFAPVDVGPRTAQVDATLSDIDVSGGGTFGALVDAFAPFLAPSIENALDISLSGVGTDGGSGGVTIEVDVEAPAVPCLLVSSSHLDFGTLAFSTSDALSTASRDVTISSCSSGDEAVLAQGTDATGDGDPAGAWTLSSAGGNPCVAPIDTYGIGLTGDAGQGPTVLQVSTGTSSWLTLGAEASAPTTVDYLMPCEGSSGAGQTMSSQITFTAAAP